MINVAEAQALIGARIAALPAERVTLGAALGRTLAEPIIAPRAQPPFAASAMDGYAVRSADTPGRLKVIGEAAAGRLFVGALQAGEAVRIFTGAPVPEGADAILIQEDAQRDGDTVTAPALKAGLSVRAAGIDFKAGAALLETGRALDGVALALAAAAGRAELEVVGRPRVAILSGGDEIVAPGAAPNAAQIFDSASPGVAGFAQSWGAHAHAAAPLPDNRDAIARAAETALGVSDLVVIIGGASVGDHDLARAALDALGAELVFSKVAVRPGKPTWFALCDGKPVLGLPGNPASALVCARLFLRPALDTMLGRAGAFPFQAARLREPLAGNDQRESYLRAALETDDAGQAWARCFSAQDSSLLSVFAASDCLVRRAAHAPAAAAGEIVPILKF